MDYFSSPTELAEMLREKYPFIPFGNGRSYGDSALADQIAGTRQYAYFLDFDHATGTLHCQSGLLLSDILEVFIPQGWFLNTTPGTRYITVGGAIAADVHGKNHHSYGTFCKSVTQFNLMLPDQSIVSCSRTVNSALFHATCGGMGLTGVILDVKLQLKKINSTQIDQVTYKTRHLQDTISAFIEHKNQPYSVAWIDCTASRKNLGRSIITFGDHAASGKLTFSNKSKLSLPIDLPSLALNKYTLRAFNKAYYWLPQKGQSTQKTTINSFFYPLDSIDNWNRLYGKNGFLQYQFVLPLETSEAGLTDILGKIAESGKGSFLAVLKLLGPVNDNWLSFPQKGFTLALDFKVDSTIFTFLNKLDATVLNHGGRFYLAKDARLDASAFASGYPRLSDFRQLRQTYGMDKVFQSKQSFRLGL